MRARAEGGDGGGGGGGGGNVWPRLPESAKRQIFCPLDSKHAAFPRSVACEGNGCVYLCLFVCVCGGACVRASRYKKEPYLVIKVELGADVLSVPAMCTIRRSRHGGGGGGGDVCMGGTLREGYL